MILRERGWKIPWFMFSRVFPSCVLLILSCALAILNLSWRIAFRMCPGERLPTVSPSGSGTVQHRLCFLKLLLFLAKCNILGNVWFCFSLFYFLCPAPPRMFSFSSGTCWSAMLHPLGLFGLHIFFFQPHLRVSCLCWALAI